MSIFKLTKKDWLDCLGLLAVYTVVSIILQVIFKDTVYSMTEWQGLTLAFAYAFGKSSMIGKDLI